MNIRKFALVFLSSSLLMNTAVIAQTINISESATRSSIPLNSDPGISSAPLTKPGEDQELSIVQKKMGRWHDMEDIGPYSAAVTEAEQTILHTWDSFRQPSRPFGRMHFTLSDLGDISNLSITSEGTEEDNFFILQSTWESAPIMTLSNLNAPPKSYGVGFGLPAKARKKNLHRAKIRTVFVHQIPARVLDTNKELFTLEEIEGEANRFQISIKEAKNPLLKQFRLEWVKFWQRNSHPSKAQVLDQRDSLVKMLDRLHV